MLQYRQMDFVHVLNSGVMLGYSLPLPVAAPFYVWVYSYLYFNMVYIV